MLLFNFWGGFGKTTPGIRTKTWDEGSTTASFGTALFCGQQNQILNRKLHLELASVLCSEISFAFCSPAKGLTFSGLMENPLVGKKLKS